MIENTESEQASKSASIFFQLFLQKTNKQTRNSFFFLLQRQTHTHLVTNKDKNREIKSNIEKRKENKTIEVNHCARLSE